jgi:hypothetical protein
MVPEFPRLPLLGRAADRTIPPAPNGTEGPVRERRVRIALATATSALGLLYLWRGLTEHGTAESTTWLGLDRWAFAGRPWPVVLAAAAVAAGLGVHARPDVARRLATITGAALDRRSVRIATAAAATLAFWLVNNRYENSDGSMLQEKFAGAGPSGFVTPDEMLELYVHWRLWNVLHGLWGWDVAQTYRLVSALAGGAAVLIVLGFVRRFPASRRFALVAGLFAGGWVLVFFGDVEDYSVTNALVLGYLVAALRFLDDDEAALWPVGVLLGVATLFHLEALVLTPSLLVLARIASRRGHRRDAVLAVTAVPVLVLAGFLFFLGNGFTLDDVVLHSQISADGGEWSRYFAPADASYFWRQFQLLLLLAPTVVLLPAALAVRRLRSDVHAIFLAAAAVGALLMVVLWRAQLGQYGDWNLYAVAAQPIALLVLTRLGVGDRMRGNAAWLAAFLVLAATQAGAWVAEHHWLA